MKKRKNKKKDKNKNKQKFGFIKFLFVFVFFIFILIFGYYFIKENYDIKNTLSSLKNDFFSPKHNVSVLLLGVSTDINTELTDTIIVCTYNPNTHKAYMLSIPRDTFIGENKNLAKGRDKINSLYTRSGIDVMREKAEEITGLNIEYYAVVKTEALIDIVDAIGGIDFNVPIDMDYDDVTQDLHIHLDAGNQHIDGEKAEQLLRFRHNNDGSSYPNSYGDNDFGRMRTQRDFIAETLKQTVSFKNLFKVGNIIGSINKNIETNLTVFSIIKYSTSAMKIDTESISSYQLPGEAKKINSIWFFECDQEKTKILINEIEKEIDE